MRRLLVLCLLALALPAAATAHPLGNFTVNRYGELVVSGDRLYLRYVLDLAEIPAFQEGDEVRRPGFAARLARGLTVEVDGRRAPLRTLDSRATARPGAGGLDTLRFEAVYDAGPAGRSLLVRSRAFGDRLGWRELVVRAERGARIERSTVAATSASDALRRYPKGDPLDVGSASAVAVPGSEPGSPPAIGEGMRTARAESLVAGDLSPGFVFASLLLALFWGAAHALGPGHGKAIVAGYLVGARGTSRHALLLGLIVTVTHTVGVFAIGLVTLALSSVLLPEQLYPWLNLAAGLLVLGVGAGVLRQRLAHARAPVRGHHHDHRHHELTARGLLGVGVSGGIVPCPTALVVLLAAISLHRVGFGLLLIVAFSVGLAASISGLGLLAVGARRVLGGLGSDGRLVRTLPAASAVLVLVLGLGMTVRALAPLV
ncbi:MAG TPA: hypothetical protein VLB86_09315 [Gaiellaceae bacterium]|nr:hypothetical protein [Gaiellaceae bacterium]